MLNGVKLGTLLVKCLDSLEIALNEPATRHLPRHQCHVHVFDCCLDQLEALRIGNAGRRQKATHHTDGGDHLDWLIERNFFHCPSSRTSSS